MNINEQLLEAIKQNDYSKVEVLLDEFNDGDYSAITNIDVPIVFQTIRNNYDDKLLQLFTKKGVSLKVFGECDRNLLAKSIAENNIFCFLHLLSKGISPNAEQPENSKYNIFVPIIEATQKGFLFWIKCLIESGADVNFKDHLKRTAIVYSSPYFEIFRELILNGADPKIAGIGFNQKRDVTVFEKAVECKNNFVINMLNEYKDGNLILKPTNFLESIRKRKIHKLREFIENDGNLEVKDQWGFTPLLEATACNFKEGIMMLVKAGADLNTHDDSGNTPLHLAAKSLNESLVDFFLSMNANPDVQEFHMKRTPLMFAVLRGNNKIIERYLKTKANFTIVDANTDCCIDFFPLNALSLITSGRQCSFELYKAMYIRIKKQCDDLKQPLLAALLLGRHAKYVNIPLENTNQKNNITHKHSGCIISSLLFLIIITSATLLYF